jgi:SAM-dependent methyltransferase
MKTHAIEQGKVRALMSSIQIGSPESKAMVGSYIDQNLIRFTRTLQAIPPASGHGRLLDVAGLANLIPCYQQMLGYDRVSITSASKDSPFVPPGLEDSFQKLENVEISYFNVEFDPFPFPDQSFDTVICCEVIEHMTVDPMALMAEINRVCKPGGALVMTTPNIAGWKNLARMVAGSHPMSFNSFSAISNDRHNREYTPREMGAMLDDAGFDVVEQTTFSQSGLEAGHRWLKWCIKPLSRFWELPGDNERGDFILVVGRKTSGVRNRLPDWLYGQFAEDRALLACTGHTWGH